MRNITSYILMLCVWGMMACDLTEKTSDNKPVAPSHLSYTATSNLRLVGRIIPAMKPNFISSAKVTSTPTG